MIGCRPRCRRFEGGFLSDTELGFALTLFSKAAFPPLRPQASGPAYRTGCLKSGAPGKLYATTGGRGLRSGKTLRANIFIFMFTII
jgi:hypothetical protein